MAFVKRVRSKKKHNPHGLYRRTWDAQAYKIALLGADNKRLADFFDIGVSTLDKIIKNEPTFKAAIKEGKMIADAEIANSYFHRAKGYSHQDEVIMANQVKEYNEEGKLIRSYNDPLHIPIIKHYPPDAHACQKWLAIRDRVNWAETTNLNINSTINQNINISYLTEAISDPKQFTTKELNEVLEIALKESIKENGIAQN